MRLRHRRATAEYQNELNEVFSQPKMTKSLKTLTREYEKLAKAIDPQGKPYSEYTLEKIDKLVQNDPYAAAEYLNNHPLLNAQHIQTIAEKNPYSAAIYLKDHKDFNAQHIQAIAENNPSAAAYHLKNHPLLNAQHIDTIVQKDPSAALNLKNHKDFNAQHINTIVQNDPYSAARYLKDHRLLSKEYTDSIQDPTKKQQAIDFQNKFIDTIVQNDPSPAAEYLKGHHLLNAQHIDTIAQKEPDAAARHLKDHKDFNAQHIDTIVRKNPYSAVKHLKDHSLFNAQHIQTIAEKNSEAAAYYLKDHRLLSKEYTDSIQDPIKKQQAIDFQNKFIDTIVQNNPSAAAKYLNNHPLLNEQHIDTIVQKAPRAAAIYLKDHKDFNAQHIDTIVQNEPSTAAEYLKDHHLLNAQHIQAIAENNPSAAAYHLKNHPLLNAQHIDTIVQKDPSAALNLKNHKDFNAQHINTIVQKAPRAAEYLNNHPLLNAQHIQTIAENNPYSAVKHLKDHKDFNAQHIQTIAQKDPDAAAIHLKNHKDFNAQHIDTIVRKNPYLAVKHLKDHKDFNAQHIDTIVQKDPDAAARYLKDHPIYQAKYLNKPISFSSNTEKLRKLRDIAESNNGVIHAKQFAKYGLNENAFGITHLKDAKGNYSAQAIQNHIDSLPKHSYYYSKNIWEGGQRHTDKPQNVFQLNITPEIKDKLQNEGVLDTFNEAHNILYSSGHPVHKGTLGWVRYNKAGNNYHIDEVQTDLSHNNLSKLPAIVNSLHGNDDNKKNKLLQLFTPDKLKKMHNILFSNQHPSKLIHEAFLQHMRNKGKVGSWVHIWQAEPKAELAGQDTSKDLPVHMKVGYDEVPLKMGYEAATYGNRKPQTNKELHGAGTWQAPLRKSLKALVAEYEKLQKVRYENDTVYPEMADALNNTPHPNKSHLVAFKARNGQPVWRYNDRVSAEEDNKLRSLAAGGLGNKISKLSGMNQRHVRELVTNLLQNPDRHVMSANTNPNSHPSHVELRARHLINALIGKDEYSITDHSLGIEIFAPRHSKSNKAQDTATSWIYDTKTKQIKSLRHYPKSTVGGKG